MRLSNTHFDLKQPYWRDYLPYLKHFANTEFPNCEQLNAHLAPELKTAGGAAIRFVASTELDNSAYEQRIYTSGQISTRPRHWHDLFNAMVWMRFPRIKLAMNHRHFHAHARAESGSRGPQRDALTLFDECGVIVFSAEHESLDALAQRQWTRLFQSEALKQQANYLICGHAILEKYLSPYKSMTAKALLVKTSAAAINLPRQKLLQQLDQKIADLLLEGKILTTPASLTPLPLSGIPGWWPLGPQDNEFYADRDVFRPPPVSLTPAPIIEL